MAPTTTISTFGTMMGLATTAASTVDSRPRPTTPMLMPASPHPPRAALAAQQPSPPPPPLRPAALEGCQPRWAMRMETFKAPSSMAVMAMPIKVINSKPQRGRALAVAPRPLQSFLPAVGRCVLGVGLALCSLLLLPQGPQAEEEGVGALVQTLLSSRAPLRLQRPAPPRFPPFLCLWGVVRTEALPLFRSPPPLAVLRAAPPLSPRCCATSPP